MIQNANAVYVYVVFLKRETIFPIAEGRVSVEKDVTQKYCQIFTVQELIVTQPLEYYYS